MPKRTSTSGSELFIVDNSDHDWKVLRYLHDWCQISKGIDIATAYFEIGSLLALKREWQKVDVIRVLMGEEVSLRTRRAFEAGLARVKGKLDESLESEKETNDFLAGVPEIVEAIKSGQILCRVYRNEKFHAKAYITHARLEVIGSSALVGSSNFTYPGLTENIELNVQITGAPVSVLQEWYEEHWNDAEDITPEVLRTIERHVREYSPFEVYAKALQEFFRGHEMTVDEWEIAGPEHGGSRMYPVLDKYQKDGYQALMKIANTHSGAFLCDGVGLGKTYIGLMLIERLVMHERKRVALFVPKAARYPVWEAKLRRHLPLIGGDFSNLVIFNHTDLLRGGEYQSRLDRLAELADVIIVDEGHHFRNPGLKGEPGDRRSRYWRLFDITSGKKLFLLTATPINNRLIDLQHMIELFTQREPDYFKEAPLGIHSLPGHFRKMEKELERLVNEAEGQEVTETNEAEAEMVLANDALFHALVVQRSRAYVKESQKQQGGVQAIFPEREPPRVADYSIKRTYGRLLDLVEKAFSKEKPLFSLALYYPLAYYKGLEDSISEFAFRENRQKQLVRLIRIQFLKRFESSARAFEMSCETLLLKLLVWVTKHSNSPSDKHRLDRWKNQHTDLIEQVQEHRQEFLGEDSEDIDEDIISDEMLEDIEELSADEYKVDEILDETYLDLDQVARFLDELKRFEPANDDKLNALIALLRKEPTLRDQKVLIFSEYMATARYLKKQLIAAGIDGVDEVDSADKRDRGEVIERFSPYYNDSSSGQLAARGKPEIRVLISTDVLSEGLNLQDATRLINYDLHWNPVRLMQRIGRVDRRLDPDVEQRMRADHPGEKHIRGTVVFWNFLPPDELDRLLRLYRKVSHKVLRISKTFGVEGRKLLTPQDDYEALKEFNHKYEGTPSEVERMKLELQKLLAENPGLEDRLNALPGRVFSGKEHPTPDTRAVFFCYALPAREPGDGVDGDRDEWSIAAGITQWYLYDLATEKMLEDAMQISGFIRCTPAAPRHCLIEHATLAEIRAKIEKHIKNSYLKKVQAPVGVKPTLKAWMELS
ncbi:MAG TPA: helicase-related protein [Blastocatellia bacterium]|nr:helicase-related protein [Blastocatellia bacterium]